MNELLALLRLDGFVFVRNPAGLLSLIGIGLLIGLSPLLSGFLDDNLDAEPVEAAKACPTPAPPMAAAGEWPEWLGTPSPNAPVTLEVTRLPGTWALSMSGGTDQQQSVVRRCVSERAKEARQSRRAELGIDPLPTVKVTSDRPVVATADRSISMIGAVLALAALALGGSVPIDVLPRRRKTGMYESLRATSISMASMTGAILALAALTSSLVVVVAAPLWMLCTPDVGVAEVLRGAINAIPLALVVTAMSMRSVLFATALQEALLRWFGVFFGVVLATTAAWFSLKPGYEPLVAMIPVGGQALASAGLLGPWWPLSIVVSLLTAIALCLHCGRLLDADADSGSGIDPTILRHGRGNFLPEVLVLSAFGAAASTTVSIGAVGDHVYLVTVLGFITFMMLPAVLTPTVLNLPRSLLPTGRPSPQQLLAGTLIAVGMVGIGPAVLSFSGMILPESPYNAMMMEQMSELLSDWRVAIGVGLLPGFCEEFLFRGAIQGLLQRTGRFWTANLGQALLFAVAHTASIRLLWTFLFGLILGWVLHRCRTLWVGVWIHTLHNTLAVLTMLYLPQLFGWTSAVVGVLLTAGGMLLLRSQK